jgi:hypothetical protein
VERVVSFNAEQRAHMSYLASLPADKRCWCGWGRAGACATPSPCPPDTTLADRLVTEMPCCGRAAARPDMARTSGSHYAHCKPAWREHERSLVDLGGEGGEA